ncbi:MAG TPA: hypothetical protein VGP25_20355 [Gemmatimonadaceae bacterium]|jgi:serine/threonine protein kinase|nr:hypothetical protein [Gemmatimonadaceae bacterium]
MSRRPSNHQGQGSSPCLAAHEIARAVADPRVQGIIAEELDVALQGAPDPNIDTRADLYARGVLAYELLTGAPPFAGRIPRQLLAAHIASRRRRSRSARHPPAAETPNWPNASLDKGIATQMGMTRVALLVEPDRLVIDGSTVTLADGKETLLLTGVQVSRRSNQYVISSESDTRVRAVLHARYVDAHVGLGREAQQPRGLIGNPSET